MEQIVLTQNLSKQYGKILRVKELSLSVPEGAVYGFLGPNGAGKSTTLKMILGLVRPTGGHIVVFGRQMNDRNRLTILKNTGSLIESPSYYGHLSGRENLQVICTLKNLPMSEIERVLKIVRLTEQKEKPVKHYSLGMKQRLGLASALLGNPKLLILDEPTNGLDPAGIQEMRELICSLPGEYGMTVLLSSHLLSEVDQIATNVGIISSGSLVFQGTLAALHKKSRHRIALRTLNNESAEAVLREYNMACEPEEGYLLFPSLPDETLADLVSHLADRKIGVTRVEERQKSLEDLFLELTGTEGSL
jgi:lantibiotic transport system ATP-binding protein